MSLKSVLGLEAAKKIRYGIVALGDISQRALMPGVAHTGNSTIAALVTGDREKATKVADQYGLPHDACYDYDGFADLLKSGKIDAVYIATPNQRHEEFAVPALRAGVHVLLEKPMDINVAACQRIIDAQRSRPGTKLMIAYRLHYEPATLAVIDAVRSGKVGTPRFFTAAMAQPLDPDNHRAKHGVLDGPLYDLGVYPTNAARGLFGTEPLEVSAVGVHHADSGLPTDFDHTVSITLKFSGDRLAQFTVSYAAANVDTYTVVGADGYLTLDPAFGYGKPKTMTITAGGKPASETFKPTDHFGGELKAFSDHILSNTDPEPDGEEGLLDVRVVEAVIQSLESGKPVSLEPRTRSKQIDVSAAESLRVVVPPEEINAKPPGKQ